MSSNARQKKPRIYASNESLTKNTIERLATNSGSEFNEKYETIKAADWG